MCAVSMKMLKSWSAVVQNSTDIDDPVTDSSSFESVQLEVDDDDCHLKDFNPEAERK